MRNAFVISVAMSIVGCTVAAPGAGEGALGEGTCEPTVTTLYAGRTIDVGSVSIETEGDELVVRVLTTGDWLVEGLHVYAGTDPVPRNPGGNVAPGSFPYALVVSPASGSAELRIPLAELEASCGTVLEVAVHADVARVRAGGYVQRESGWGFGTVFGGRQWGWSFTTTVCCEEVTGCTLTQGYWKNHADAWPTTSLTLGGTTYGQAELLELLDTPPRGDASLVLGHQLTAAELDAATGASVGADAQAAIAAANVWLAANDDADGRLPFGVPASSAAGADAVAIAATLAAYNEGRLGTPHCD